MTDAVVAMLSRAQHWIAHAPHGDNCFVSSHYEGDPGDQCNCGKSSLEDAIHELLIEHESALPTPAPTMVDERGELDVAQSSIHTEAARVIEAWENSPLRANDGMLFERIEDLRATLCAQAAGLPEAKEEILRLHDAADALVEDGWTWDGDQWQRPPSREAATRPTLQSLGGDAGVTEAGHVAFRNWLDGEEFFNLCLDYRGAGLLAQEKYEKLQEGIERAALPLTSTEKSNGWISVEEHLPEIGPEEEGVPVWTWDGNTVEHDEFVANYEQPAGPAVGGWLRTDDWFASDLFSHVTHWQPYSKPAAPKAAEKSGRSE